MLNWLATRGLKAFAVQWSPMYMFPMTAQTICETDLHPLYETIRDRYATRTDPLWWMVVSSKKRAPKKVLRSWLTARSRIAFRKALKRHSYDGNGRHLRSSSSDNDLLGTMVLHVTPENRDTSWADLCKEADEIVRVLQRQSQRNMPIRRLETRWHQ